MSAFSNVQDYIPIVHQTLFIRQQGDRDNHLCNKMLCGPQFERAGRADGAGRRRQDGPQRPTLKQQMLLTRAGLLIPRLAQYRRKLPVRRDRGDLRALTSLGRTATMWYHRT